MAWVDVPADQAAGMDPDDVRLRPVGGGSTVTCSAGMRGVPLQRAPRALAEVDALLTNRIARLPGSASNLRTIVLQFFIWHKSMLL